MAIQLANTGVYLPQAFKMQRGYDNSLYVIIGVTQWLLLRSAPCPSCRGREQFSIGFQTHAGVESISPVTFGI